MNGQLGFLKRTRRGLLAVVLLLLLSFGLALAQDTPEQCPLGQGYWKNHAVWPVTELALGGQTYSQVELVILLNTPSTGDASLILAYQLIAAKLNAASGLDITVISGVISEADAVLSGFADKLPYAVEPASAEGQTLVNLANILESYNSGVLSAGCVMPPEATPEATPEMTPEPDDNSDLPITIVIEGPVQAIHVNIITIYNIDIELDPDDPILTVIQIGDLVRVAGNVAHRGATIVIIVVNITFINVDVVVFEGQVWRDMGDCGNPPPPWAPANGWRRRCESGRNGSSGSK